MQFDGVDRASPNNNRPRDSIFSINEDANFCQNAEYSESDVLIKPASSRNLEHHFSSTNEIPTHSHSVADNSEATNAAHTNLLRDLQTQGADTLPKKDVPWQDSPRIGTGSCTWLPVTLRIPYLLTLFFITLILAIVVLLLCYESWNHNGLSSDNGTSELFFDWRFTPTLVAVLLVAMETFLLKDIKRTEVFARLSARTGSPALFTILQAPSSWWKDPVIALGRKRNGGRRSRVLFWASIMNIIGTLILSPLSAAFLSSEPTEVSVRIKFSTLPSTKAMTQELSPNDETLFRTVAALALDLKTSIWVTDDYAVIPFLPTGESSIPLGATILTQSSVNWSVITTVFRSELNCVPMTVSDINETSYQLPPNDGCTLYINVGIPYGEATASDPGFASNGPAKVGQQPIPAYYPIINEGACWVLTSISPTNFSTASIFDRSTYCGCGS